MMTKAEREAWLAERRNYVTASDVAAIMGLNPHKTRKKVFNDKVKGITEDIDRLPVVMAGKHLEPGVFSWHCAHRFFDGFGWDEFRELLGREDGGAHIQGGRPAFEDRVTDGGLVTHPTCRALAATPDGLTWDESGKMWATEIKNVKHDKWQFDWAKTWRSGNSTNIPVGTVVHSAVREIDGSKLRSPQYYWAQLQAQMSCLGLSCGRLVVCFGGQSRADLDFPLDKDFEARMIREVESFWYEVEAGREILGA